MREDDFFLNKRDQDHLRVILTRDIPDLIEQLYITSSRQDRIVRPEMSKIRRGKPESVVPINFNSAGAQIELHNALATSVRHMCEERALPYEGDSSTLGLCGWLNRYLVAFALTEGAEDFYRDLAGAVRAAYRAIDLPDEDDIVIDEVRVQAANRQSLTAEGVERIASRLGEQGKGLTAARVNSLRRAGHLSPCSRDRDTNVLFYRLGDVLHAHREVKSRTRKASA